MGYSRKKPNRAGGGELEEMEKWNFQAARGGDIGKKSK